MKKLWPILGLLLWFLLTWTCTDSGKDRCCSVGSDVIDSPSAAAAAGAIDIKRNAFMNAGDKAFFKWGDCDPITADDFARFRDSILNGMPENRALQIIGQYCSEEGRGSCDVDNLGLSRAQRMRNLFLRGNVAAEKVKVSSELRDLQCENLKSIAFSSIRYRFLRDSEFVKQQGDNKTLIYFPFNSDQKISNPEIEEYLREVAERLKSGDETLKIVGHTDNIGSPSDNRVLGQQRADAIKALLVSYGVSRNKIDASSMGEDSPLNDNSTDAKRALNRRTELIIQS